MRDPWQVALPGFALSGRIRTARVITTITLILAALLLSAVSVLGATHPVVALLGITTGMLSYITFDAWRRVREARDVIKGGENHA